MRVQHFGSCITYGYNTPSRTSVQACPLTLLFFANVFNSKGASPSEEYQSAPLIIVDATSDGTLVAANNRFVSNGIKPGLEAISIGEGGAMSINTDTKITGSVFADNVAATGGAIAFGVRYTTRITLELFKCVFKRNVSDSLSVRTARPFVHL
jgi:hypothetical protein